MATSAVIAERHEPSRVNAVKDAISIPGMAGQRAI